MRNDLRTVTLDTNVLDPPKIDQIRAHATAHGLDLAIVTVSEREGRFAVQLGTSVIRETFVWDESKWDHAVWGGTDGRLDEVLEIVSSGSFPERRDHLTTNQRSQLRDAIIFEAHRRERRDLFVTDDRRGFIEYGRREKLEELGSTRILTSAEFLDVEIV